ncbi:HdeD family acid-resistance protein [Candidatus Electrothrix sp.]|uniref:HdeD family acid-resistance protein n=1 Tax=Candidatus Electrothrix sp. TaxID=2170559 RepID=UPI004055EBFB
MDMVEKQISFVFADNWWVLLLRGIIALVFGVLAWVYPGITLTLLILFFGVYILTDGILHVGASIAGRRQNRYWWTGLLGGLIGIIIGLVTFLAPGVTAFALLIAIAVWALLTGILDIVTAIQLRKEIQGEWLLIFSGVASFLLGILLLIMPSAGILTLLWLLATYAVLFGLLLVLLAFKVRKLRT